MWKARSFLAALLLLTFAPMLTHSASEPAAAASMTAIIHALSDHPRQSDRCGGCPEDEPRPPVCLLACGGSHFLVSAVEVAVFLPMRIRFDPEPARQVLGAISAPEPPPPKALLV